MMMKASTQQGIIDEKQKTTEINEFPPIEFHPMCVFLEMLWQGSFQKKKTGKKVPSPHPFQWHIISVN